MRYLSVMDYTIIGAYFLFLIGMGLYLRRRASSNIEEYFLAGRKMPWWLLGVSGMAWSLDMTGTMLITSLLYILGPRGFFIEFRGGANLSLIFMMIWTGKWHRRSGCMTLAEWMSFRFGNGWGGQFARISSAIAFVIFTIGMLAYLVKGAGLFLSLFIPVSPFWCALVLIAVSTIYTITSGMYGVVFSDLLQTVLIVAGTIFIVVLACGQIADGPGLAEVSQVVTGAKEWMTSYPQFMTHLPPGYEMYNSLFMFTMFLVLRNLIGGFGTGGEPQYFAAKNERECGKLTAFWAMLMTVRWPLMMSYAVLGLYLVYRLIPDHGILVQAAVIIKQYLGNIDKSRWSDTLANIINNPQRYPQDLIAALHGLLGQDWSGKLMLLNFYGGIDAEKILPAVLLYYVPAGFRGVIFISLLAAAMSTFSMTVNKTVAMCTNDIYRNIFRSNAGNKELIWMTYLFSLILVGVSFAMGSSARSINDIWGWIMMGLGSGMAVPLLLRFYWWRFNGGGYAASMITGVIASVTQRAFWPDLSEQWQFISLTALALIGAVVGTYLTRATETKVLEEFYIRTRPFGFWKPFKHLLSPAMQEVTAKEHRNDLLAIPFVFLWEVTMFLLPMQLIIRSYQAFVVTLILFLIGLAGTYKFWYKNLPPEPGKDEHKTVVLPEI